MSDTTAQLPPFVRDLLASPPKRGDGLNNWLFRVARVLHAFRSENEIVELLRSTTYGEHVKHGEIERLVECSRKVAWRPNERPAKAQPTWPALDGQRRVDVIAKSRAGLVDLFEASPIRFDDDQPHSEEIIDALFPDNPLLCAGPSQSVFLTRTREAWRGRLSTLALIVPSAMTARRGKTQGGKTSAHALSITGARQFLVIEQDNGSIDDQAAILLHLAECAPLAIAVHSGCKSIHGWFACHDASKQTLRDFMRYAVLLGADRQMWCRSQFARMPDGKRENGKRQTIFFFNPAVVSRPTLKSS